jgi:hypothetical protein
MLLVYSTTIVSTTFIIMGPTVPDGAGGYWKFAVNIVCVCVCATAQSKSVVKARRPTARALSPSIFAADSNYDLMNDGLVFAASSVGRNTCEAIGVEYLLGKKKGRARQR